MLRAMLLGVLLAATPAKEPVMLNFGAEVQGTPTLDTSVGADPSPLKVAVPEVRVEGGRILGELVVENPTDKALRVVVNPYGGAFPYGGTSPFTLGFRGEPAVKYTGKLYPPEPPRPLLIEFPGKARVRFTATIDLANYGWEGEPQVTLNWGFYFARKPVEGKLALRLPKK
jgi:hypothetical protein